MDRFEHEHPGPGLTLDDLIVEFGDTHAFDGLGLTPAARFRAIRRDYSTGLKTARSLAALRVKVVADLDDWSGL